MMSHVGIGGKTEQTVTVKVLEWEHVRVFDKQQAAQCAWSRLSKEEGNGRGDQGDNKEPVYVTLQTHGFLV